MKTKLYTLVLLLSLSHFAFGQTSGGGSIALKIFFDKEIFIGNVNVFYFDDNGSQLEDVTFVRNIADNSLVIKGNHSWWAAPTFPTIIFEYPEKDRTFMFYLISPYSPPYVEDKFNEKILFSFKNPNAEISRTNSNGINFKVDYRSNGFSLNFNNRINELIKIRSKDEN